MSKKVTVKEAVVILTDAIKRDLNDGNDVVNINATKALNLIAEESERTVNSIIKESGLLNIRRSAKEGSLKLSVLAAFAEAADVNFKEFMKGKNIVNIKKK
jgi:hypothetical protein